jgi:hypothetical protein
VITQVNALGGGLIEIQEGTYRVTTYILMKSNVWLKGKGEGTLLQATADLRVGGIGQSMIETFQRTLTFANDIATAPATSNMRITDMRLDGNRGGITSNSMGLYFVNAVDVHLENLHVFNQYWNGIVILNSSNFVLKDLKVYNNGNDGVSLHDTNYILIRGGIYNNNGLMPGDPAMNLCCGADLEGVTRMANNTILDGVTSQNSHIHGVQIQGNNFQVHGGLFELSQSHGINVYACTDVEIIGAVVRNNSQVEAGDYDGISFYTVTNSRITGCSVYDDQGTHTQRWGIVCLGTSSNNTAAFNDLRGNRNIQIYTDSPSKLAIFGNKGYVTENKGTATLALSTTSIKVAHGLSVRPTRVILSPTSGTGGKRFRVSSYDSDGDGLKFTITVDSSYSSNITFDWEAYVQ